MSENATEIVYIPMKPGLDLSSGEAKETWESTLSTIAKQPGAKALYWGRQIENPETVQMAVEWESIEDHRTFEKTPGYQPFLATIMEKLASGDDPTIFHVNFPAAHTRSDNPFTMPVTECVNAFFAPDYSQAEYTFQFSTFRTLATEIPNAETKGVIGGWSVEPHQHESLGVGVDGKLFAAFFGWPSVEAHMEFRKTEEFGKLIPYLRSGPKGLKVWHVAFQQYK
ncbi:uncharacterized protein J4E79_003184 [Alternaria viburni]|uniref:uncharacterized protein n=1 Tax=Alternaria viburni TaxID=566460 RepID=UPI0020C419E9|nr:uncharacterized protein J4E79_003184 [Alternaria viburni]KAI4664885.1 hypothetical protein J4E79_003184 [Alternaria viburni]